MKMDYKIDVYAPYISSLVKTRFQIVVSKVLIVGLFFLKTKAKKNEVHLIDNFISTGLCDNNNM